MDQSERRYCFIDFNVRDDAALDRLSKVAQEFQRLKGGADNSDESHWLSYFGPSDRAAFWWPSEAEKGQWDAFWFSTPIRQRHSPEMPAPPWHFGSMVEAILEGDYDIIGVRRVQSGQARLEFDPHGYPYGGTGALRVLIRAFGHKITAFDDWTGLTDGDPQPPQWTPDMPPLKPEKKGIWDRFRRGR